jgi:hypothetical protein
MTVASTRGEKFTIISIPAKGALNQVLQQISKAIYKPLFSRILTWSHVAVWASKPQYLYDEEVE